MCKYCGKDLEIFECLSCPCFECRCIECWFKFTSNIGGIFKIVEYTKQEKIKIMLQSEEYTTIQIFSTWKYKK